jgi:hypothetical protein
MWVFFNINVINSDGVKLTGQEGRKKDQKVNKNINSKPERNRALEIFVIFVVGRIILNCIFNIQDVGM